MQVLELTAVWCADVPIEIPENTVKLVLEWQASQAIPATGMWVRVEGAVGDAVAEANGMVLG